MMSAAELRNSERELQQFHLRIGIAGIAMLVAFGVLLARFLFLQVVQHDHYRSKAEDNRISIVPIPPNRGLITDRNGVVVARNYSGYTLEIFPRRVRSVEATIDELSELIEITPRDRARFKRLTVETRNPESLPIRTRLSDEEVAKFAANRFRYEGVEIKARLFRQYPYGEVGSHVIGYMGRINQADQQRLEEEGDDANYRGTDYIGKSGVEATYERELHGTTGFEQVEIDAAGRGIRTLSHTPAVSGHNVVLTLDMQLQRVAENAFGSRRGALVALEPGTGAVLALVSKPGFDLNLVVDGIDGLDAEPGGQHPVVGGGRTAALDVSEDRDAGLEPGALLDLLLQGVADPAETLVAELVHVPFLHHHRAFLGHGTLGDADDREAGSPLMTVADVVAHLFDVERDLGDEDDVGASRQTRPGGDPTGVTSHHLDHHHAVV